jgi:hypothetical protein
MSAPSHKAQVRPWTNAVPHSVQREPTYFGKAFGVNAFPGARSGN